MNFRVCESPWVKVYWYELEDLSELSDEELLQTLRTAQKFYKLAIRANGDEEKLQTLVDGADTEQNVFLSAFCRSFGVAQEKTRIYRENARKRWEKAKKEKEGVPNAEPAPLVDESEGEEKKPYGTKKNVWLSDFELQSLHDTFPMLDKREIRIAIDNVSQRYSGRFGVPSRSEWLSIMNKELESVKITKANRENAQAKLDAAKIYKDIQDAKPKIFQ